MMCKVDNGDNGGQVRPTFSGLDTDIDIYHR